MAVWYDLFSYKFIIQQFCDLDFFGKRNLTRKDNYIAFQIHDAFKSVLTTETKRLMEILEENERVWLSRDDYSVYTGSAGIAYTFYHYGKSFNDATYVKVYIKSGMFFSAVKLDAISI